jgi:hypothetical protein
LDESATIKSSHFDGFYPTLLLETFKSTIDCSFEDDAETVGRLPSALPSVGDNELQRGGGVWLISSYT